MLAAVAWSVFALIALLNSYAVARADRRSEAVLKPAALLALTTVALAGGAGEDTVGWWLVAALLFGTVGDIALLEDSDSRFLIGLSAFLVGHLAYVACFLSLGIAGSGWTVAGAIALVAALVAGRTVLPRAYADGGSVLAGPVALYMSVIGAMLVTGWATEQPLIAVGAAIFVTSDTVLAIDRFDRPPAWAAPYPHLVVMVTYHLGQALIVAGVLHAL